MKLMRISQFQQEAFSAGSAPCRETIKLGILNGTYPGVQLPNGRYFVDYDAFEAQVRVQAQEDAVVERIRGSGS